MLVELVEREIDACGVDDNIDGPGFRRGIQLDPSTRFLECPPPVGKPAKVIDLKARMRMVGINRVRNRCGERRSAGKRQDQCEMRFHQYSLSVKGRENLHVQ